MSSTSAPQITSAAKEIPQISNFTFLQQVIENFNGHINSFDGELKSLANQLSVNPEITKLAEMIRMLKIQCDDTTKYMSSLSANASGFPEIEEKLQITAATHQALNKWIESIKELQSELTNNEYDYYSLVSDLLQDVKTQAQVFKPFSSVAYVTLIFGEVTTIENQLKRQIQWAFREVGNLISSDVDANASNPSSVRQMDLSSLNRSYLVIDVLGYEFRVDLLERFAQLQLIPYEKGFKLGTKYCGLDSLDKRYTWFRQLIKVVEDELGTIFPRKWCVPYHLFVEFRRRTRNHLKDFLEQQSRSMDKQSDLNAYVNSLLLALKSILTFEAEMKAAFEVYIRGENIDTEEAESYNLKDSITEAFDSFLGPYVQLEREALDKLMDSLAEEENKLMYSNAPVDMDSGLNKGPFDSSRQMFEYIKNSLKRCTAFSTGVTYLSLSREYRICLHNYAKSLKFRCPSPIKAEADKPPIYEISAAQEISLCRLICSGEYCIDTIPPLESKMKEHIKPAFRDEIDFNAEIDAFVDMINFAMSLLIAGIDNRLQPALKEQRHVNWSNVAAVGDDSKYVKQLLAVFREAIPRIRSNIPGLYFNNFVMKLATAFLDTLMKNIFRLKRISTTGAGQLLLDLNGIETFLLEMPRTRLPADQRENLSISKAYTNLVNNRINKIEIVLKLVCTEDDRLQEMFSLLWPDGTQADFDAVVGLKAARNILPTPLAQPLNKVGKALDAVGIGGKTLDKVGLGEIGRGAKDTVSEITHGFTSVSKSAFGGLKGAFGDFSDMVMNGFDETPTPPPKSAAMAKLHSTASAVGKQAVAEKQSGSGAKQAAASPQVAQNERCKCCNGLIM